jgi:polysaccharide chain length determinant protein (PEP-CTERM system associated)
MATDAFHSRGNRALPKRGEQVVRDALNRLEAYVRGMWRFRWRAIVVMWLICLVGWTAVYLLPPVYEARARIYVDTENALRRLLPEIGRAETVLNEVLVVTREIMSRPNLAEVARTTDLDLRAETTQDFEDLLTDLSENIRVNGSVDNIYTIAYEDQDRSKAVSVVDALVNTFVEKSLGAQRTDSSQAQTFLQGQINEYEQRLTAAEDRLADFKQKNMAFMPGKEGDYFARLKSAESAVAVTRGQLNLAQQRRTELLRQLEGEEPVFGIMPSTRSGAGAGGYAAGKIRQLELELEELQLQFTDKHPRIQQILGTIELLKQQQEQEAIASVGTDTSVSPGASKPLESNPVYQNMRIQLSNTEVEIASLRGQLQQEQSRVAELQRAVNTVPQVEAELGRLNRDYDVVRQKYEELLGQLEVANIGEDVKASIDEVQFRLIDPPFSELQPAGPQRELLSAVVFVMALGAGVVLAFLMDQLNPVFFTARDVTAVTGIPVLGAVSCILSKEERFEKLRGRAKFLLAVALLMGTFAVVTSLSGHLSPLLRGVIGMGA